MVARIVRSRAWRVSTGPIGFALAVLWLLWLLVATLWPVSWWFEIRGIHVHDSIEGRPVEMTVDRVIVRDFSGKYYVQVRVVDDDGNFGPVYCEGSGGGPYFVGSQLPSPVTLTWWAAGRCADLPVGKWRAATTWYIQPDWPLLPAKTLTVFSNRFEVLPRED